MEQINFSNCSRADVEKAGYCTGFQRVSDSVDPPKLAVGIYQPHAHDTLNRFYVYRAKKGK